MYVQQYVSIAIFKYNGMEVLRYVSIVIFKYNGMEVLRCVSIIFNPHHLHTHTMLGCDTKSV